ncbi:condensin-2 complex subunit D3 [Iris pallida]|uniref:Condensin-2 complex subunit D3 n=1 Tax=Iris pallida TaxID=29817 RepID=A0AAX6III0_IRIPA|nr:condensin-2 complex subunit D3 [Iris pallida]
MDDLEEEDESLSSLLSEIETLAESESTLLSLLSLSDDAVAILFRRLPSPSSLLDPLSAAMADAPPPLSLLASRVYLSLLLSPSSPTFTLFTPLSFLSLLRSLRRSLKAHPSSDSPPSNPKKRRKGKPGGHHPSRSGSGSAGSVDSVLDLLHRVLAKVRLDAAHDGRKSLFETLASVLEASGPSDLCFQILLRVVSRPEHGDQLNSAVELFRSLVPLVLSSGKSKASVLGFVTRRIVPLGKEVEGIRKAVCYLPRFLAMKSPERSEPRAAAVESIVEIVRAMECEDRVGFVDYVVKMSEGKGSLRLLAVDLLLGLLTSLPEPMDHRNEWGVKCLEALLRRCGDSMGGIRARALTNLAQAIAFLSQDTRNCARLREVMALGSVGFRELLKKRCVDEKAAVRKASLLLVTKTTALIGGPIDEVVLKTLGFACSDLLVSIRKAALVALSEVYRRFPDDKVISEWLHSVPPLIADNETSIQEECENLFLELVLDRICRSAKVSLGSELTNLESLFPEGILDLLKGICDGEVAPCVKKICASLGKKKKLKPYVATSLQNIISTSETLWQRSSMPIEKWTAPLGAWQLLSEISLFTPKAVDWKFLHHHWKLLDKVNPEKKGEVSDEDEPESISWAGDRVSLLQTISNVSLELPPLPASELADSLLQRIEGFNMHLSEVDAHVKALRTLCKRKAVSSEEGDRLVQIWADQLLTRALKILENYVNATPEAGKTNCYVTPQSGKKKGKKEVKSTQEAVTAVFTIGSVVLACPSADFQRITPLLHTIITSRSSAPKPGKLAELKVSVKDMVPSLYIQSWVTMGKICLVDGKLAKRYIPLFVQELEKSDCAALRNNIMIMMTDFCVRYTALVDCYISKITTSLIDPCEVVRRQTFILLSRLLQRDYVKWRGVLFLRFLLSLVDESEKIRHLADFLFGNILKAKAPLLAYNSFIEAIFVLNDCNAHSGQSETQGGLPTGARSFSIRGSDEKSRSQRMHIYISLLKQMAPEHLLATSAKLCAEILAAASDGLLSIDDATGRCVLQDALQILACKEMRINQNRTSEASEMDDEGEGGALHAAKGRVVTHVAKKNLIQNAVPIFIELKRLLESKNSPLIGCLMDCLRSLLKDYKNEFDEILVADKQLQKELIYDINKHEAAKAKSTVAEAAASVRRSAAPAATTSGFLSPVAAQASAAAGIYARVSERLGSGGKIGPAVADAAARATARSVLKDVNRSAAATPPLCSMSVPKVKSRLGRSVTSGERPASNVLESLRRRQCFESDDEN